MQARPAAVIRQLALFLNKFSQAKRPGAERARLRVSMTRENLEPIERETGRNSLNQKHRAYIAKLHEARAPAMRQMAERKPRRAHRLRRVWWKAAVAAVLVFAVAASTFGSNPIKALLERVEVFFMGTNPSGQLELPEDSVSEYRSLQDALDQNGIKVKVSPTWIPSDYSVDFVRVRESDYTIRITGYYISDNRSGFRIQISDSEEDTAYIDEKIEKSGDSIIRNGIEYFILPNTENVKASWQNGQYACVISGQLTTEELEKMIESIQ